MLLYTPEKSEDQQVEVPAHPPETGESAVEVRQQWIIVAVGLVGLVAVLAMAIAAFSFAQGGGDSSTVQTVAAKPAAATSPADTPAPTIDQAKGINFEKFEAVDPTLPAVPAGAVKKFTVDVEQHVVQVAPDLAPTEVWTYVVNGKRHPGTGASEPIVVNQGDKVRIEFVNGGSKAMHVTMPHSIDFHSAEVAPNKYYVDVAPGKKEIINFTADHPGVFMYHCATQPILTHVANGMAGMMVVKPKGLAPVDKELWMTQSEFYLGKPGAGADQAKMSAEKPDVIAFNGYANQYKMEPITVRKGEKIRMYVLNAGPSKWSAFHVIGTVFDKTVSDNGIAHSVQTINLAPSQGTYAEFTLNEEGNYPFLTHSFGDMVRGAAGMLHTTKAPAPAGAEAAAAPAKAGSTGGHDMASMGGLPVELGEMFVKPGSTTAKAGKVEFSIHNTGATMHQFAIGKAPLKMAGAEPAPDAAIAKGKMLSAGGMETVSANLEAGTYVLYCVLGGHYAAGQKTDFTVTG